MEIYDDFFVYVLVAWEKSFSAYESSPLPHTTVCDISWLKHTARLKYNQSEMKKKYKINFFSPLKMHEVNTDIKFICILK